jgi:hypothetical protein
VSSGLRRAFRSFCLGVLLLAGLADRASAQSAPGLVVIISADPASPTSQGVAKDLRGLGLDVLVLKATAENSSGRASLERSARSVGAIAALRLVQAGEGLEVWVADRVTGKTVIRQLVAPPGAEAAPEDVALGAVELLRASLMELHAPTPSRGEVELTPAIRQMAYTPTVTAPPPPPRPFAPLFAMSAGPAVELGVGALGPSLHGTLAAWLQLWGALRARGFLSLPLLSERETVPEGSVRVGTEVLGVGLSYERQTLGGMLAPEISAGFAAARVGTWGKANAPFVSSFEQGWYGGGYLQVGAALRLVRGVRLRLDGTGVLLATVPEIRIGERALGTWGAPAVLASLGIEILWSP